MRIGIVSDTHIPKRAKNLPKKLLEGLRGVDLIIHAGDWVSPEVAHTLKKIAPVEGVVGNNDGSDIKALFGLKKIITAEGRRIGIIHGDGERKTTLARAIDAFSEDHVDIIIFGHSHKPYHDIHNGILVFNPGSPTDKRRQPKYSYGIIELGNTIKAKHYFFSDRS